MGNHWQPIIQTPANRKFSSIFIGSFERSGDFKQIWNVRPTPKPRRIEDYIEILFLFVFFRVILLSRSNAC